MRIAVLDLGTNTFNLLIVEAAPEGFNEVLRTKIPVKLGEGGLNRHEIAPAAFERGINALHTHATTIKQHKVDQLKAVATSAIRSTTNGPDFVRAAKEATGIEIEVIDGLREAELICGGVRAFLDLGSEPVLIIDIGGGSTEFIIASDSEILWKHSFALGVSRIKELFAPSDPISTDEIDRLEAFLVEELRPLWEQVARFKPNNLIGSSGSFDSLMSMLDAATPYPPELPPNDFDLERVHQLHQTLLTSTLPERLNMPGLLDFRADMIVLASLLIQLVLRETGINRMQCSAFALKEGLAVELLRTA